MQVVFLNGPISFEEGIVECQSRGIQPIIVAESRFASRLDVVEGVSTFFLDRLDLNGVVNLLEENECDNILNVYAFSDQDVLLSVLLNQHYGISTVVNDQSIVSYQSKMNLRNTLSGNIHLAPYEVLSLDQVSSFLDDNKSDGNFILKPAVGYSSLGVAKVDEGFSLSSYLDKMPDVFSKLAQDCVIKDSDLFSQIQNQTILAESFIEGQEAAVDLVVINGEIHFSQVCSKAPMKEPWFEEIMYLVPGDFSVEASSALFEASKKIVDLLQVKTSIMHIEFIIDASDTPFFIDLGFRMGGRGLSSRLCSVSTGYSLFGMYLDGLLNKGISKSLVIRERSLLYLQQVKEGGIVSALPMMDKSVSADFSVHCVEDDSFIQPDQVLSGYPDHSGLPGYFLFSLPKTVPMSDVNRFVHFCYENLNPEYKGN